MRTILTVNAGSSSARLAAFSVESGKRERLASLHSGPSEPAGLLASFIRDNGIDGISAVSHRIVHGGIRLSAPCIITPEVENEIRRLSPLAPLHNPVALEWIEASRRMLGPGAVHVAVFDTAFYSKMPEVASIYALPPDICRMHGIRRYGFHGIAHRMMWERLGELSPAARGRTVSLQLGAGCSVTAAEGGRAVDTSMGFSPVEGLVMATRSGDLDPRVVTYLERHAGLDPDGIDDLLTRSSGLLGVSGLSGDMKSLLEADSPGARLAIDLYCYRARKYIGAYMAALGGADAVLFGGGVGENSPEIRRRILSGTEWCGITVDEAANRAAAGKEGRISPEGSPVEVWVLPVDEAALMADEAARVLKESGR